MTLKWKKKETDEYNRNVLCSLYDNRLFLFKLMIKWKLQFGKKTNFFCEQNFGILNNACHRWQIGGLNHSKLNKRKLINTRYVEKLTIYDTKFSWLILRVKLFRKKNPF